MGWLDLAGDERVLDAGCGTGQVTRELLRRLPKGTVVALDGSPSMIELLERRRRTVILDADMIEQARVRLAEDRVEFLVHDLLDPIPLPPVDAILSTATFHWVRDHDRLFANLAGVLRHGGQLAAQCGGAGNTERLATVVRDLGYDLQEDTVFADRVLAARRADADPAKRPRALPPDDLPRIGRGPDPGGGAGRCPAPRRRAPPRRRDRLRPPQHPRSASTAGSASGPPR